ncbi:hypothetical protein [Millisia brevis]|uniref:hypothetical protein n=1 Tax=Millisia brevis TaxID=264148 RepID=UPI000829BA16|nr:hypothetical protein [Millisia brevis]
MADEAGKSKSGPGAWGIGAASGLVVGTFVYIPLANLLLGTFGLSMPRADDPEAGLSILHWVVWVLALLLLLIPGIGMMVSHRLRHAGIAYLGMTLVVGGIAAYAMISGISPASP